MRLSGRSVRKHIAALALGTVAVLAAGCVHAPFTASAPPVEVGVTPWAESSAASLDTVSPATKWRHQVFPGKATTDFSYARKDGRHAMAVRAVSSASMLRRKVRIEPADLGRVRFSWRVPELIAGADMARRDTDDAPVRVVLVFEGDRARFSQRDAMLSELAHAVTGEPLPYATLMYVWCNQREPGAMITSARTSRIRKLVVESGPNRLNQWLDYERDIAADYERAFGEKPGALVGIGVMTDSDNTRSTTNAWYGPLHLVSARRPVSRK